MSQHRSPVILMYHGTPGSRPDTHYSIHANLFAKHMRFLKRQGWTTALFKDLQNAQALPEKTVVLTFDDGYADNYQGAFLPLLESGMKATWFIATDCIGGHAHWLGTASKQTQMLTKEQLTEMHSAGMEIASHTCSHPDLSTLSLAQQQNELSTAKSVLEKLLSTQVTSLAYPYGRFNDDSLIAAEQAGYRLACITQPGWLGSDPNPFLVRRIAIFSGDSVSSLSRKLTFTDNEVSWQKIARYYMNRARAKLTYNF
ncbi:polysaccharide deacetylase family protein [Methylomonas montana]|uniref:polysaccharide deacetylase family protein n=1 Tax=Methylomonas montana TaxID=3058963 RepID=UPI00265B5687|nr:polysaccharide deacetylase family protein [Methylomonas montana]WKJ91887.1 polysaccharide deacetylase family protein [Methylomonas montana]